MEITYVWKITALKKAPSLNGLSDVITHIRFDYTGTDAISGESHTFHGACPVGAPNAESFTPLTEITEENVIAWAQANHPTDHMNEVIAKEISKKVTPVNEDVTELSWLQTSASVEEVLEEELAAEEEAVEESAEEQPEA